MVTRLMQLIAFVLSLASLQCLNINITKAQSVYDTVQLSKFQSINIIELENAKRWPKQISVNPNGNITIPTTDTTLNITENLSLRATDAAGDTYIHTLEFKQNKLNIHHIEKIEMATGLRKSGKFYVVLLVLLTIFATILLFLFRTEQKLKKLEANT
jgi:hypothetical protein